MVVASAFERAPCFVSVGDANRQLRTRLPSGVSPPGWANDLRRTDLNRSHPLRAKRYSQERLFFIITDTDREVGTNEEQQYGH